MTSHRNRDEHGCQLSRSLAPPRVTARAQEPLSRKGERSVVISPNRWFETDQRPPAFTLWRVRLMR